MRAAITGTATVVSGVGLFAVSNVPDPSTRTPQVLLFAGGAVLTALTGGIPTWEQWRQVKERREAETLAASAKAELRLFLSDYLAGVTATLATLTTLQGTNREQVRGQAVIGLLTAAATVVGGDRTRACFYELEQGPPRRLVCASNRSVGRADAPTAPFQEGTVRGDTALRMVVDDKRRLYVSDVSTDPPPGWTGTTSDYRTFVSVAVYSGERCHGMLSIDSLNPGELDTEAQSGLVEVMAHLLGAILSA